MFKLWQNDNERLRRIKIKKWTAKNGRKMRKVIKYLDNNERTWDTEKEALLSDAKIVLNNSFHNPSVGGEIDLDEWINIAKKTQI